MKIQIIGLPDDTKGSNGLPDFSQGTAPVQDPQQAQQEVMSKQFMQLGGKKKGYGNVYGPQYTQYITEHPENFLLPPSKVPFTIDGTQHKSGAGLYGSNMNPDNLDEFKNMHSWYFKNHPNFKGTPNDVKDFQKAYNEEATRRGYNPYFVGKEGSSPRAVDGKFGEYTRRAPGFTGINIARPPMEGMFPFGAPEEAKPAPSVGAATPAPVTNPYSAPNVPVRPYESNIGLTPSQKLDLGNSLYNAVSINKYAPKREQSSFTPVNLERDNVQPYLNDIDNNIQQGYKATSTMSPIQARAQNSQMFGRGLEAKSQARGQVFSRNSQISNQENLYNNQGVNRTAEENMGLDNKYYDQVNALNQNYDNESRFARNQVADKYFKHIGDNQALAMGIMSQPFGTIDKTDKNGNPYKQASPLFDFNYQTGKPFYTGASMSLDQIPTGREEDVESMFKRFVAQGIEPKDAMRSAVYYVTKTQANNRQRNPYKS